MNDYKENLRHNLKSLRKSLGLSQKEFAEKIGKTQGFISQVEKGISFIDADTMFRICEEFDISTDDLSGRKTDPIIEDLPLSPAGKITVHTTAQLLLDKPLQEALEIYFTLSPEEKQHVIETIKIMGKKR